MAQSSTAQANATSIQEVEITFEGRSYRVRPTYQLLARVERVTDRPAKDLGIECAAILATYQERQLRQVKEVGLEGMALILSAVLMDKLDVPMTADQIGESLMEKGGYEDNAASLSLLLLRFLKGNEEYERGIREKAAAKEQEAGPDAPANPPLAVAAE